MAFRKYGDPPPNRDRTSMGREWKPEKSPIDYLKDKVSKPKEREHEERVRRHRIETECSEPGCKNEATEFSDGISGTCITHTDFGQIMDDDSPRWDDGRTENPEM